ncbi:MAG: metal-sensitive transcriptional regulator [Ignavibacteriae bacterium]|nr:metal-sensitive transcriptional regulator [Ignavibacteriota bacterium]NOG99775.1 metal-sensitive transcriptional regulator [Ignavibacteriota bacterium]
MEQLREIKTLKKHLHYINGQIEGIENMIDENRDIGDVYIQCKAVEGSLQKIIYVLLEDLLRKELAQKIVKVVNACPGNCEDAQKIEFVKNEFPKMEIKKVSSIIHEMNTIEERLVRLNNKN